MRFWLTLQLAIFSILCARSADFRLSPQLESAYWMIMDLRLVEAQQEIDAVKECDPENLLVYHIENYIDFVKAFISEKETDYHHLLHASERRIERLDSGIDTSPYFRFSQAEVLLQNALVGIKHGAYFRVFRQVSHAYDLLSENQELYPSFITNKKSLGLLHALIGSVPSQYRWGIELLGFEGSIDQGRKEIEMVIERSKGESSIFREEAIILYSYVLVHLCNKPDQARDAIKQIDTAGCQKGLISFIKGGIQLKMGKCNAALLSLDEIPVGGQYLEIPQAHYLRGLAYLYALDPRADDHLKLFLDIFEGGNYVKDACMKMAWFQLIFSEGRDYQQWMAQCLDRGGLLIDEDRYAQSVALDGKKSNIGLLKARLLFDGGYFDRSLEELVAINSANLNKRELLELEYRRARNYQAMGDFDRALVIYDQILSVKDDQEMYEVANSALQAGLIYEELGMYDKSEALYKRCIDLDPLQYNTSLDQKAGNGLNRIKKAGQVSTGADR